MEVNEYQKDSRLFLSFPKSSRATILPEKKRYKIPLKRKVPPKSRLGIDLHFVELLPNGEVILDSANSKLYRLSFSLSLYARPKLVSGSAEGYSGHINGKSKEAKLKHPMGLTVDETLPILTIWQSGR
ncbi:OLC1v1025494C1 [Oldenlandia corymbosa var. corymbosa]|uniref:OLC1v1025494C1 n=1 Tax=Oldenlandia corymbosa var. corymbosa TaxID=529605 RepID=A0AAV1C8A2_OLDCO|nr:OLC1v1025494C1 [Oldenlandia corymbosa var. corymbosa]